MVADVLCDNRVFLWTALAITAPQPPLAGMSGTVPLISEDLLLPLPLLPLLHPQIWPWPWLHPTSVTQLCFFSAPESQPAVSFSSGCTYPWAEGGPQANPKAQRRHKDAACLDLLAAILPSLLIVCWGEWQPWGSSYPSQPPSRRAPMLRDISIVHPPVLGTIPPGRMVLLSAELLFLLLPVSEGLCF